MVSPGRAVRRRGVIQATARPTWPQSIDVELTFESLDTSVCAYQELSRQHSSRGAVANRYRRESIGHVMQVLKICIRIILVAQELGLIIESIHCALDRTSEVAYVQESAASSGTVETNRYMRHVSGACRICSLGGISTWSSAKYHATVVHTVLQQLVALLKKGHSRSPVIFFSLRVCPSPSQYNRFLT